MCDNWQTTQQMFGSLFEKPKMTEKLLCRPPFKFIFDIIMETQKATKFAKGLYNEEESQGAYYANKDLKIQFLKKLQDITSLMLKEEFQCKPTKIVAGLEPEQTNILLQGVYRAALSLENSAPFVKQVLKQHGQPIPADLDDGADQQQEQQEKPKPKPKKKKPEEQEQMVRKAPAREIEQESTANEKPKKRPQPRQDKDNEDDEDRPITASKTSKAPPKQPKNVKVVDERKQKQGGVSGVIRDGGNNDDDDDLEADLNNHGNNFRQVDQSGQHGKMVRDALNDDLDLEAEKKDTREKESSSGGAIKMKKRLGGKKQRPSGGTGTSVTGGGGSLATGGSGGMKSSIDDVEGLTKLVQAICQSANPLGKSLEFINDDIESMNNELQYWNKQYQQSKEKMQRELRVSDDVLSPLQDKITEIELKIQDEKAKIQNMKSQIIKNQYTIQTLLHSVVVSK